MGIFIFSYIYRTPCRLSAYNIPTFYPQFCECIQNDQDPQINDFLFLHNSSIILVQVDQTIHDDLDNTT